LNGIDIAIFRSKRDSIPIHIALQAPVIGAGGHRMGFTPARVRSRRVWRSLYLCKSDHGECKKVYIFNSKCWGKKIKIESISNWEQKTQSSHHYYKLPV